MSACCLAPATGIDRLTAVEEITTLEQAKDLGIGRAGLALAAAWAPNPTRPPFYIDRPTVNGEPQPDVIAALNANAANVMFHQYIPALQSLDAIGIEIGLQDNLLDGNVRMHDLLDQYGIEHDRHTYEGGHGEILGERMQNYMLPFFSEHLKFQE